MCSCILIHHTSVSADSLRWQEAKGPVTKVVRMRAASSEEENTETGTTRAFTSHSFSVHTVAVEAEDVVHAIVSAHTFLIVESVGIRRKTRQRAWARAVFECGETLLSPEPQE